MVDKNRKEKQFREEIIPALKEKFGFSNDLQVPRLQKIVITRGINAEESKTSSVIDELVNDIAVISGQKPIIRKAKKSMVTLRSERMYAFFDRFVSLASPRVRDFQGFKIKSDGNGNFTVGIKDQRIFLETENRPSKGLQITIVTSGSDEEGRALLEQFGFPFSKN